MAFPPQTNITISTIPTPLPSILITTGSNTAFTTVNTTGGAVTANLSADTFIFTDDGGIWDDTQRCWIPVTLTTRRPTPRVQDGN